ncbi:MAG: hypothetical protein KGI69_03875 [Patescibacteria group bacterium]|nr:hypothetical protein [Patescibacteria group bacterium]
MKSILLMHTRTARKILLALSVMAAVTATWSYSHAQTSSGSNPISNSAAQYTPLEPLPSCGQGGCSTSLATSIDFHTYIQNAFSFFIFLSASAAVFMIALGGLQYMTTDSIQGKTAGREKAVNAVYGLLLVLGSYLILRTIDPRLVAIPTTLVAPLNVDYKKNVTSDFFSGLSAQVNQNDQNFQNAMSNIQADQQKLSQLQSDQQNLNDQICYYAGLSSCTDQDIADICDNVPTGNANIDDLCFSLAQNSSSQQTTQNDVAFNTVKGLLLGSIPNKCSPTGDPSLCNPAVITSLYLKYSNKVSTQQIPQLASVALYAETVINMNKQAAELYANAKEGLLAQFLGQELVSNPQGNKDVYAQYQSTLSQINDEVTKYVNSPDATPDLVDQLKTQQQSLTSIINGMTYHR